MHFVKLTFRGTDNGFVYVNMAKVKSFSLMFDKQGTRLDFASDYNLTVKERPEEILACLPPQS